MRTLIVLLLAAATVALGQPAVQRPAPSATIYGNLVRLNNLVRVLYVAAHPDDENTRLLAWLARGRHIPTAYLSITRGDGGQNIIGSEQGPALGLIRSHELLAARQLDGADQFFGRAVDYGFSKNPEEAFTIWDRERLIGDVVWIYRTYRPDVVICRFPKDSMAGHGQHSVSAIVAEDAFRRSASPAAFAEQLLHTTPWQPRRLLLNAYRFGTRSTIREGMFRLDVGQYDPLLGMGYGELAGVSRSIHRSQGAGTPSIPGVLPEFFGTVAGDAPKASLFDGIDTTWGRVGRPDLTPRVQAIINAFSMQHPERSVPALLELRREVATLSDVFWRREKLAEIDQLIIDCMGLYADASLTETPTTLAGTTHQASARIVSRAERTVFLTSIRWPDGTLTSGEALEPDSLVTVTQSITIPPTTRPTEPYWLQQPSRESLFTIPADTFLGRPTTPSSLPVRFTLVVGSDTVAVTTALASKRLDPLRGDVIEPLRIVPRASVEPAVPVIYATPRQQLSIPVRIRANGPITQARLTYSSRSGPTGSLDGISIPSGRDTLISIYISAGSVSAQDTIRFALAVDGQVFTKSFHTIAYDHLPTLQYATDAAVHVTVAPFEHRIKRVGYIEGAGDYIPTFLKGLGIQVDNLSDEELLRTDSLMKYDAIISGVRLVNVRKSIKYLLPALFRYVERGGTFLMQYNTLQDMATKDLGPFPFSISNKRVTQERAPVSTIRADHPILLHPNRLTSAAFDGWVQERGLYFPDTWDPKYQTVLSMNDTGELPLQGSILHARHGKGNYVYTSLSMFRQLPAGVPGAAMLFLNMLSLGK
jgi:LmbE family N-acetylglucosaminyl deacetylase